MSTTPIRRSRSAGVAALALSVMVGGLGGAQAAVAMNAAPAARPAVVVVTGADQDQFEAEVLRLTNEARSHSRKCGGQKFKAARSLRWSPVLAASADQHSTDMATQDYFSHYTPSGSSPFDRMRAAGYRYRAAGENIAAGRSLADPAAVVRAWLNSPGHCKVLMNPRYRELGVGRAEGPGKWSVYWTQNFGRPL